MKKTTVWLSSILFASILVAACGGGGGSGSTGISGGTTAGGNGGTSGSAPNPVAPPPPEPTSSLSLWVGNAGGRGNLDGKGTEARFWDPASAVSDSHGNLFVVDNFLNTIRKVSPDGTVSTFAGASGTIGSADGIGSEARFNFDKPSGITIDKADNLYVADVGNNIVRKITPSALVTTIAGQAGQSGNLDGVGTDARLQFCFDEIGCVAPGMAVDSTGAVYFVESGNYKIRKILPTGEVRSFWGKNCGYGGGGNTDPTTCFDLKLTGLAIDSSDRIYIAERGTVRVMGADGKMMPYAGDKNHLMTADGIGGSAGFSDAHGLALDDNGNAYVLDGMLLRKIARDTSVTTIAGDVSAWNGGSRDGKGTLAQFAYPSSLAVDHTGAVYVVDTGNQTIRKVGTDGLVSTLAGAPELAGSVDGTGLAARFSLIEGLVFDAAGNLFVSDTQNSTIRKITSAGVVSTFAGRAGQSGSQDGMADSALFFEPTGMAIDSGGNLFVADMFNNKIRKLSSGAVVTTIPQPVFTDSSFPTAVSFFEPRGVSIDTSDNIFIADSGNSVIRKIDRSGSASTFAGHATGSVGMADGAGSAASFNTPYRLVNDKAGNVFVADTFNNTIRKITPDGIVTTFAGVAGEAGFSDGRGSQAHFYRPQGITIDNADNLYVADTFNHVIRKITPAGIVTTVVGQAGSAGFHAGSLPGTLLFPEAVAMKGRSLYISTSKGIAIATNVP